MKPSEIIYSNIAKAIEITGIEDNWIVTPEQNAIAVASIIKYLDEQYEKRQES